MTVGSPWKLIAGFALPVLLSQIFQQLYNTADSLIVGRFLGDEALAAVSSSGPLIFLMTSFFEGLTLGAGVAISRYFGADDDARVERAIHANIFVNLLSGIFLTIFGVLATPTILRWMGAEKREKLSGASLARLLGEISPKISTTMVMTAVDRDTPASPKYCTKITVAKLAEAMFTMLLPMRMVESRVS